MTQIRKIIKWYLSWYEVISLFLIFIDSSSFLICQEWILSDLNWFNWFNIFFPWSILKKLIRINLSIKTIINWQCWFKSTSFNKISRTVQKRWIKCLSIFCQNIQKACKYYLRKLFNLNLISISQYSSRKLQTYQIFGASHCEIRK